MPRLIYDWKAIQQYHNQGHGFVACRNKFGVTHTAWNKAISTGRLLTAPSRFKDRRRRYDWSEIQRHYDQGHSYYECMAKFGFNPLSWYKARQRGEIHTRPLGKPMDELLRTSRSRRTIKQRLLNAGILQNRCDECGINEWQGKPLSIHVDHINGVRDDHRLENLRMLCPNCHSQTDTYSGKNVRRRKALQDGRLEV